MSLKNKLKNLAKYGSALAVLNLGIYTYTNTQINNFNSKNESLETIIDDHYILEKRNSIAAVIRPNQLIEESLMNNKISKTSSGYLFERAWPDSLVGQSINIWSLIFNRKGELFAGTTGGIYNFGGGAIYKSPDGGKTWTKIPFPNFLVYSLDINREGWLFASCWGNTGLYISKDDGSTWVESRNGLTQRWGFDVGVNEVGHLFFSRTDGIWRSTDNGQNWIAINNGLPLWGDGRVVGTRSPVFLNNNIFIAVGADGPNTYFSKVYKSNDNGNNWVASANGILPIVPISTLLVVNNTIFAGGLHYGVNNETVSNNIYRSTDNGENWETVLNRASIHRALTTDSLGNIFAGFDFSIEGSYYYDLPGIYRSKDNGNIWERIDAGGLADSQGRAAIISLISDSKGYLYAGTWDGVYKSTEPIVTSVERLATNELPNSYVLKQNYPNPFNPSTTIEFLIPSSNLATLKIYNILGKELETLVNKELSPGNYKFNWDAKNLSSGIYFYQLKADNYIDTKKMILLK